MRVSTLPWDAIGQGALSEMIGSLLATGLVTGGGWLIRRVRRRRRSKTDTLTPALCRTPRGRAARSTPEFHTRHRLPDAAREHGR